MGMRIDNTVKTMKNRKLKPLSENSRLSKDRAEKIIVTDHEYGS